MFMMVTKAFFIIQLESMVKIIFHLILHIMTQ